MTGIINDYKTCKVFGRKVDSKKLSAQDKGQSTMMAEFFSQMKDGNLPISMDSVFKVTKATFAALDSISLNSKVINI